MVSKWQLFCGAGMDSELRQVDDNAVDIMAPGRSILATAVENIDKY